MLSILSRPQCFKSLIHKADSMLNAPSQWETSLQSNAVSHWLGANLKNQPCMHIIFARLKSMTSTPVQRTTPASWLQTETTATYSGNATPRRNSPSPSLNPRGIAQPEMGQNARGSGSHALVISMLYNHLVGCMLNQMMKLSCLKVVYCTWIGLETFLLVSF